MLSNFCIDDEDMVSQISATELHDGKWMAKRTETTELIKKGIDARGDVFFFFFCLLEFVQFSRPDYIASKVQLVEAIEIAIKRLNTARTENAVLMTVLGRVNSSVSALQGTFYASSFFSSSSFFFFIFFFFFFFYFFGIQFVPSSSFSFSFLFSSHC
jgi:hypothetical protein